MFLYTLSHVKNGRDVYHTIHVNVSTAYFVPEPFFDKCITGSSSQILTLGVPLHAYVRCSRHIRRFTTQISDENVAVT